MSSAPRAAGRHLPWAEVPVAVRDRVDSSLGSPVVSWADQVGGMSPGCATRVVCADGTRAFVKAVGAELNPDTPRLLRREAYALGQLGSHELWAGLVASHDDADGWVTLVLEDVEGSHPHLDDAAARSELLAATDDLTGVMAARLAHLRPPPEAPAHPSELTDTRIAFASWAESTPSWADAPGALPRWVVVRLDDIGPRLAELATGQPCHTLHHGDIRNDNLLQRPDGSLVFVDWGMFGWGPAWYDPVIAGLSWVEDPAFDDQIEAHPAVRAARESADGDPWRDPVTLFLLGLGGYLAWRSVVVQDVNLPTLKEFRRRESARFLGAAARRLGLA